MKKRNCKDNNIKYKEQYYKNRRRCSRRSRFCKCKSKDILTEVIKVNAPKMIIIHNHPSGDPTPSRADIEITNRIYACCELFQIKLLDHIVIGDGKFESIFSKKGLWN